MFYKPIFIVHGRVKGFFKSYTTVQNKAPHLQNWEWHMHNEIVAINAKIQVSVQILLYNKK